MKSVDLNSSTYINFNVGNNDYSKFEVGDYVRISKYFCKRLHAKLVL